VECEKLSTYTSGKDLLHVYVEAIEKILKHPKSEVGSDIKWRRL
jgi:hypothetical protein